MLPMLASLKGLTKLQTFTIDNNVFRLHYKVTVLILAMFSLVVSYTQFFGNPISCTNPGANSALTQDVVENYCWSHYTYSYRSLFDKPVGHQPGEVIYYGVGDTPTADKDDVVKHKYYQWVCFVLALQAIMFYLPRYLWKALEGERVKNLVLGLNVPTIETEECRKKQEILLRYLKNHRGLNFKYAAGYAFTEFLNFANLIGQMFLLDTFFGGEFTKFGMKVVQFTYEDPETRTDPMIMVFPRLTVCDFFFHQVSGRKIPANVYCVLPLNIINEKIFIFIWFWFVFLLTLTSIALLYRVVVMLVPAVRLVMLKARCPMALQEDVARVVSCTDIGDWFVMYQLSKNVESQYMAEVLHLYAQDCENSKRTWAPLRSEGPYRIKDDVV